MGVEENKRIAEADVMCIGPDKLAEKIAYYTDDAVAWDSVIRVMGYAGDNTVTGIEEVTKFFTWLANLPPVSATVECVFGEGENVAVEWTLAGGEGADRFEIPCANIYSFQAGKIRSVRMQFDSASFAEIVGKG